MIRLVAILLHMELLRLRLIARYCDRSERRIIGRRVRHDIEILNEASKAVEFARWKL